MSNVNVVVLSGNLTRDPELRSTSGGTSVCKLGLAVNSRRKNRDGDWEDAPSFFNVTVFGRQGENCAEYLNKGRGVVLNGELRQSSWENDQGEKRSAIEVIANNIQFLPDGRSNGGGSSRESDIPIDSPEMPAPSAVQISDDDIPF